jgi:hypothetical protein
MSVHHVVIAAQGVVANITVDGERVSRVRGYSLQHVAGGLPMLRIELQSDRLDFSGNAHVEQHVADCPIGYAVLTADNHFVGIYRNRETAEKVLARSPMAKGERIVEYMPR